MRFIAIIVCAVVGVCCVASGVWAGEPEIGTRIFHVAGYKIIKFIDPDNGNVCYISALSGYGGGGVSCLKP